MTPQRLGPLAACAMAAALCALMPAEAARYVDHATQQAVARERTAGAGSGRGDDAARAQRVAALKAAGGYTDAAAADLVHSLPGWGAVDEFNLFAG